MRSALVAFVIATVVAAVLTPLIRRLALRLGAVSVPHIRHVHARSIPRLGGVAICIALFVPVLGLFFVESAVAQLFQTQVPKVAALLVGGAAMCIVGVVDDTRGMRNLHKLYAQVAVAVLAYACGLRIDGIALPLIGPVSMGVFALPVTILWIVGITNAVNLIDGLDGLAAGVVFFAGVTNVVVAFLIGAGFVALLMAAMLGAVLGFLFYNFNPARIFMGDSGSYFLGYVLAATSLAGIYKVSTAVSLLVPVVALGVPIFDTLFAMVRRFLERRPIFSPDRGHIHHRLLDLGITHRRAVLILYGLSVLFTVAAVAIYLGRSWQVGLALVVASTVLIGMVRFMGYFSISLLRKRQRTRLRSRDTELLRHVLPQVPALFAAAPSEKALFEALGTVAGQSRLASVEVRHVGLRVAAPIYSWSDAGGSERRLVASMTYPLGPDALARAEVRFCCTNDFDELDVPPQTDILLQVVADILTTNLERLGSDLAPRRSTSPELAEPTPAASAPQESSHCEPATDQHPVPDEKAAEAEHAGQTSSTLDPAQVD